MMSFYFSLLMFCFLWLTATNSPEAMMDSDDDYNFDSDFSWWEPPLTWSAIWCWICSRLDFKMITWLSGSITFFILIDRENVFLQKTKATLRPEEVAWNIVKLMVVAWENSRHFATPLLVSPRSGVWWTSAVNRVWNFCALFSDAISQGNECGVARCRPDCWLVYYMSQSGLMLLQVSSMDPSLRASALGHILVSRAAWPS